MNFIVTTDTPALFSSARAIAADGTLTFTPATDANGIGLVRVELHDDGGSSNDGGDTSAEATFSVIVTAVNDAPSFTAGANPTVLENVSARTFTAWATQLSSGPEDESAQTRTFLISIDKPERFAVAPAIAPDGTLSFTPAANANGTAAVTVRLQDSGGTADGGIDTSAPVTFKIEITTYLEEAGIYNGLAQAAPNTTPSNSRAGLIRVSVAKQGTFTASLILATERFVIRGRFDKSGVAHFGSNAATTFTITRSLQAPLVLSLEMAVGSNTDKLAGTLTENAVPFAIIDADRALYTASTRPIAPLMTTPAILPGRYTVVFNTDDLVLTAGEYPQGDGVGVVRVAADSTAFLLGSLADGTPITCANAISKNNTWPLYAPFLSGRGSISGFITFRDVTAISDLDAAELQWFKPAIVKAKQYPAGWPQGLKPNLVGSKFIFPAGAEHRSVMPGLNPVSPAGNAEVVFTDGDLPVSITKAVNVAANNYVTVPTPGADRLVFGLYSSRAVTDDAMADVASAIGRINGSFVHPVTKVRTSVEGVILQKQGLGTGFFLGATHGGAITVTPLP